MSESNIRNKKPLFEDKLVGMLIRHRRQLHELSQEQLAQRVGFTFQQLQKYETGSNRVTVGRLLQLLDALGESPVKFFQELDVYRRESKTDDVINTDVTRDEEALVHGRALMDLVSCYNAIHQGELKAHLLSMARQIRDLDSKPAIQP